MAVEASSTMAQLSLTILDRSLITPSSTSPHKTLFLSAADLLCRSLPYNRRVLFFRISPHHYHVVLHNLKQSLSTVLVEFYPLAGRLYEGESGRLEVACNDLGAEFVEASVDGVSLSDWENDNFDMKPCFESLTQRATHTAKDLLTAPLLSIQVTRFKCGGIALGVAHSHVLADGHSLWHFMTSWAECGRGEPISASPVHTRTLLQLNNPCKEKADLGLQEIEAENKEQEKPGKTQRLFSFNKEMMLRLKDKAGRGFSSYEVIAAHIWKCVTKARGHKSDTRVGFISVLNMRKRMDPPLPDTYFGNAIHWGIATATASELQHEDLATTASRMRVSLTSRTGSCMERLLHWLELHGPTMLFDRVLINDARLRVSSSPKFPVYHTNFGWGAPIAVRSITVEELGKIVLYPGIEGLGSIDVCMALPTLVMHKLANDPIFTHDLSSPM